MSTVYDHNSKAGNAGDILKHVALIAALNSVTVTGRSLRFVDLFAGYGVNPIIAGNQWDQGLGRIHGCETESSNSDLRSYLDWYLSRPSLIGSLYPGSSLIAQDTLRASGHEIGLTLYDISETAIANLQQVYRGMDHRILHRAAQLSDPEIESADFLFIDPPGLKSEVQPEYPTLAQLLAFTEVASNASALFWLPVSADNDGSEDSKQLRGLGFTVSRAMWGSEYAAGSTLGCLLAYRLDADGVKRVQQALDAMFVLAGWQEAKGAELTH